MDAPRSLRSHYQKRARSEEYLSDSYHQRRFENMHRPNEGSPEKKTDNHYDEDAYNKSELATSEDREQRWNKGLHSSASSLERPTRRQRHNNRETAPESQIIFESESSVGGELGQFHGATVDSTSPALLRQRHIQQYHYCPQVHQPLTLLHLPEVVIHHIFSFLEVPSLLALSLVSKAVRTQADTLPWKDVYDRYVEPFLL